jgi:hypothetical protein
VEESKMTKGTWGTVCAMSAGWSVMTVVNLLRHRPEPSPLPILNAIALIIMMVSLYKAVKAE